MPGVEQGQLVQVRNRFYIVQDVHDASASGKAQPARRVILECMDDDRLGDTLSVIWQREIDPKPFDAIDLPSPADWDAPSRMNAFLRTIRWSSASVVEGPALQAPFRAAIGFPRW